METYFETCVKTLYERATTIISIFFKENHKDDHPTITAPKDFAEDFFSFVDKVNLSLMEDKDNFYGYFLFQMSKEIRFDLSSPTAVNFKGAKYVIYFNPLIFLTLTMKQMESTIKHEILHILSMHLIRAKECRTKYGTLATNMAMDVVVNTYLDYLPPYATTLEWVNLNFSLKLLPFESFEYYAEKFQTAIDLLAEDKDAVEDDSHQDEQLEIHYDPERTHDLWEDSSDMDEKTLKEFTEKAITHAQKGTIPDYLKSMISSLKNSQAELPWNLYLKRLIGRIESNQKKTITRRNRRQPQRLDLRGQLRSHKANIIVALDISGSISDEEFNQAMKEVLSIIRNYNTEIKIIECDNEIKRIYNIKVAKDIKNRLNRSGGTKFSPVFEYANHHKANLLIYFTDGKGEDQLLSPPRGYKTLWIISGRGDDLSLKETYGAVKKLNPIKIKATTLDMSNLIREGYSMNHQEDMHI